MVTSGQMIVFTGKTASIKTILAPKLFKIKGVQTIHFVKIQGNPFEKLEVESRYSDTQQVTENVCDLLNLSSNINQCFKIEGIYLLLTIGCTGTLKNTKVSCSRHQCSKC